MGRCKSLLPLRGRSIIQHVVSTVIRATGRVVVVTGHRRDLIVRALRKFPVTFTYNPRHASGGMISSVQAGVRAVALGHDRPEAIFLMLGDQPCVKRKTLHALFNAWKIARPRIVRPAYQSKYGHPILLDARGFDEILQLPRGATLRTYTSAHANDTVSVLVEDRGVLEDVDTPRDYRLLLKLSGSRRTQPCPV
jgi:molybdenum cofactor cytidylyltransferase